MTLLQRIQECHSYNLDEFLPFFVQSQQVGWIHHLFAPHLLKYSSVFSQKNHSIHLNPAFKTYNQRSQEVEKVLRDLYREGKMEGWRGENYPVASAWGEPAFLEIERAAVVKLGVKGYGIHVNGFVGQGRDLKLWVAKRSLNRPVAPGKLDHLVAGGQPIGLSLLDNLIKEAKEEAGIAKNLAAQAIPVGALSYLMQLEETLRQDTIFCYDLELPESFRPLNQDGEVSEFHLYPIQTVKEILETTQQFKFNTGMVIIDFMIRHGVIGPDEISYLDLIQELHPVLPSFQSLSS